MGVGLGVGVGVAVGVDVGVGVTVGVEVGVGVGVPVTVGVGVNVAVGLAVAVGVGVGVPSGPMKTYLESVPMPLLKTVTKAGPMGKSATDVEVKEVSDHPAAGSIERKSSWLLSRLRSWTNG